MLLEIDGKRYPMVNADEATIADLIAIERQTGVGVLELQEMSQRFEGLSDAESKQAAEEDPGAAMLMFGIALWLSRRKAGETSLTLEEACDVRLDDIRMIAEPGDKKAEAKPAAKKTSKKAASANPK
jgi:hypothetical protein